MEETFAQINGAAQYSFGGVNVGIKHDGSIVGTGIAASSEAISACGGNLDKILNSFGGVAGGNNTFGGKASAVVTQMSTLGGKMVNNLEKELTKIHEEASDLEQLSTLAKSAMEHIEADEAKHVLEKIHKNMGETASNIRSVVGKALDAPKLSAESFMARNKEFMSAIGNLGARANETNKAGMLSLSFTSVNELNKIAKEVSEALKTVGMKKKDYLNEQTVSNIDKELFNKLNSQLSSKVSNDSLVKFLKAWSTLCDHHGHRSEFADKVTGGVPSASKLADRLLSNREELRTIINRFISAFGLNLNNMVKAINGMSEDLGKRIDYDEKTQIFLDTFKRLKEFIGNDRRAKIYQYLLELNNETQVDSKEVKDRFLSLLRDLSERASAMDSTAATKAFAQECQQIASTVNRFNDMVKSFRDNMKKTGGNSDTMNELFSIDAAKIDISGLLNPIDNLNTAVNKIEFFRNIAIFRSNLNQTNKELVEYSKDYTASVGKAIGEAITKIQNEYTEIINQINDNKSGMGLEIDMYNESQPNNQKVSKEKLKMIYKWQCDARIGLYKTVEAIDLYLLHFTETVTKNPDAVADLQKLLTATKIIAKWYDDKAGDNLIRVFEMMAQNSAGDFIDDTRLDKADFIASEYNATFKSSVNLTEKLGGERANKLYERCRRAVEGVVVLKNIISYFITISEKYGNGFKGEKNIYMAPSNIYKNLVNYIWVSALDVSTVGTELLNENNEIKRMITYDDTKVGIAQVSQFDPETLGINFNKHSVDKLRLLKTHQELMLLKNFSASVEEEEIKRFKQFITTTFARLGKTKYIFYMIYLGVYDLSIMSTDMIRDFVTFLQSKTTAGGARFKFNIDSIGGVILESATIDNIVKSISAIAPNERNVKVAIQVDYTRGDVWASDAMVNLNTFKNMDASALPRLNGMRIFNVSATSRLTESRSPATDMGNGFLHGLLTGLMGSKDTEIKMSYSKRAISVLQYSVIKMLEQFKRDHNSSVFAIDDTYFILTIKAIAGKVMAVTGINSIYKNPNASHNALTQSPTRLIMGGADDVEVIDDAVELYVRLPLLVEFYRKIFDNGNKDFKNDASSLDNLDNEQISFVPEVGNVWSGLLINIFDKSKHIETGLYTSDNMRKIVSEINSIYKHYKGSVPADQLTRHIVLELISEINRRYGVIKRQDLLNYYKIIKATKESDAIEFGESNYTNNDLDILNEDLEFEEKSPSEAYIKLKSTIADPSVSTETKINKLTDYKIVKEFRERINGELNNIATTTSPVVSLRERIRFLKKAIVSKSSRQEKYDMIIKAIEESDSLNQSSNDIFMCFHEMVVMPLRTLHQMHNALKGFILNLYVLTLSANQSGIVSNNELFNSLINDMKQEIAQNNSILTNPAGRPGLIEGSLKTRPSNLLNIPLYNIAADSTVNFVDLRGVAGTQISELQLALNQLLLQFTTNAGDLIKLNISTTKRLALDLSEFQKVCEYLLANVKYMVDKFTGLVPSELIQRVTDTANVGSVYFLERELLTKFFNKYNQSESKRHVLCIDNVYKLMPVISNILFETPIQPDVLLRKSILHDGPNRSIHDSMMMPFLRDSFMQFNKRDGMYILPPQSSTYISDLLFNPSMKASFIASDQPKFGYVQEFNIIISRILSDLYDSQSRKIYTKVFNNFASSALTDALNGQSFADFELVNGERPAPGAAIPRGPTFNYDAPKTQTILSSALAYAMKVLMNRVNPVTGVKIHEVASIEDLSPHMMEKYRMLIPMYLRICNAFIARCKLFRKIVGYMNVTPAAGGPDRVNIIPAPLPSGPSADVKENISDTGIRFSSSYASINGTPIASLKDIELLYLDEIVNGMSSLLEDLKGVQKELLASDSTITLYFDVKKDFTKNYVATNKDLPFAPLSILAMGYANSNENEGVVPIYNQSQIVSNKFLYGLRTMLVDDFKISSTKVPYLKKLITDFNGYSTNGNSISEAKFNDVLQYIGKANNFIYDIRFYNGLAISHMDILKHFTSSTVPGRSLLTYQESNSSNSAMTLIESVDVLDSTNKIAQYIKVDSVRSIDAIGERPLPLGVNPRSAVIMVNILDLNVMPINVHSLMRDVPLVNLYNYAMTFDALVDQLATAPGTPELGIEQYMQTLLKEPYKQITLSPDGSFNLNVGSATSPSYVDMFLSMQMNDLRYVSDILVKKMTNTSPPRVGGVLSNEAIYSRINTKLVRNILFLTFVQAAIKQKVKRELEFINTRIVSNTAVVNNAITNANTDLGPVTENMFEF